MEIKRVLEENKRLVQELEKLRNVPKTESECQTFVPVLNSSSSQCEVQTTENGSQTTVKKFTDRQNSPIVPEASEIVSKLNIQLSDNMSNYS